MLMLLFILNVHILKSEDGCFTVTNTKAINITFLTLGIKHYDVHKKWLIFWPSGVSWTQSKSMVEHFGENS